MEDDITSAINVANISCADKPKTQTSLNSFIQAVKTNSPGGSTRDWEDVLVSKIASMVLQMMNSNDVPPKDQHKNMSESDAAESIEAANLLEYVKQVKDLEIFGEEDDRILRCNSCAQFLSSPACFALEFRLPTG